MENEIPNMSIYSNTNTNFYPAGDNNSDPASSSKGTPSKKRKRKSKSKVKRDEELCSFKKERVKSERETYDKRLESCQSFERRLIRTNEIQSASLNDKDDEIKRLETQLKKLYAEKQQENIITNLRIVELSFANHESLLYKCRKWYDDYTERYRNVSANCLYFLYRLNIFTVLLS